MKNFNKGQEYYLEVSIIDESGDFVNGLSITYNVRKSSDNTSIQSGSMTEEGDVYKVAITIADTGQYRALYTSPEGYENYTEIIIVEEKVEDRVWDEPLAGHLGGDKTGQHLEDADTVADLTNVAQAVWEYLSNGTGSDSMKDLAKKAVGLSQHNYRIFNPVYSTVDEQSVMTKATIKIYENASDCNNNVNAITSYSVVATFDANANMVTYKVIEA